MRKPHDDGAAPLFAAANHDAPPPPDAPCFEAASGCGNPVEALQSPSDGPASLGASGKARSFDELVDLLVAEHARVLRLLESMDFLHAPKVMEPENDFTDMTKEGPASRASNADLMMKGHGEVTETVRSASSQLLRAKFQENQMSSEIYEEICKEAQMSTKHDTADGGNKLMTTNACGRVLQGIVRTTCFEICFAVLILINSITIGVEVDIAARGPPSPEVLQVFSTAHMFFFVAFTIELALRMADQGRSFIQTSDTLWWNWFDIFVVGTATLELVIGMLDVGPDAEVSSNNLRLMRMLRLARLVRIVRVSRIIRFIRALRYLVQSILYTLKSLVWAMVLLLLILYCFATALTQAATEFRSTHIDDGIQDAAGAMVYWWGSLPSSIFTLFMAISGGVSWHVAVEPLRIIGSHCVALFTLYIAFTYFAVLNVVTGVFCQSAMESAEKDRDHMLQLIMQNKQEYTRKLKYLFDYCDTDGSGEITLDEFNVHISNHEVVCMFESIGIQVDDVKEFFTMLDADKGGGVDMGEILEGCMRMKGPAKGTDMVRIMNDMKSIKLAVRHCVQMMEDQFSEPETRDWNRV